MNTTNQSKAHRENEINVETFLLPTWNCCIFNIKKNVPFVVDMVSVLCSNIFQIILQNNNCSVIIVNWKQIIATLLVIDMLGTMKIHWEKRKIDVGSSLTGSLKPKFTIFPLSLSRIRDILCPFRLHVNFWIGKLRFNGLFLDSRHFSSFIL